MLRDKLLRVFVSRISPPLEAIPKQDFPEIRLIHDCLRSHGQALNLHFPNPWWCHQIAIPNYLNLIGVLDKEFNLPNLLMAIGPYSHW